MAYRWLILSCLSFITFPCLFLFLSVSLVCLCSFLHCLSLPCLSLSSCIILHDLYMSSANFAWSFHEFLCLAFLWLILPCMAFSYFAFLWPSFALSYLHSFTLHSSYLLYLAFCLPFLSFSFCTFLPLLVSYYLPLPSVSHCFIVHYLAFPSITGTRHPVALPWLALPCLASNWPCMMLHCLALNCHVLHSLHCVAFVCIASPLSHPIHCYYCLFSACRCSWWDIHWSDAQWEDRRSLLSDEWCLPTMDHNGQLDIH